MRSFIWRTLPYGRVLPHDVLPYTMRWSIQLPLEILAELGERRLDLASFDDTVEDDVWSDDGFSYELRVDYAAWKDRYRR